jgi:alkylhydroperoxidase family enzyme
VLRSRFFSDEQVAAIAQDYRQAGLEPAEVAMMAYAEKITLHAYKVTPEDIDGLRAHGFSDTDILDIALTAAARSFYSKMLDATGAEPDPQYLELPPELRQALTVGRPFRENGA